MSHIIGRKYLSVTEWSLRLCRAISHIDYNKSSTTVRSRQIVLVLLLPQHAHDPVKRDRRARLALRLAPDRLLVLRAGDGAAVQGDARVRRDERVERGVKVRVGLRAVERAQVLLHPVGEDGEVDVLGGGQCE